MDLNVTFRYKFLLFGLGLVVLQLNTNPDDAIFMSEQSGYLLVGDRFEGLGQIEMDSFEDHFVVAGRIIHNLRHFCCWW